MDRISCKLCGNDNNLRSVMYSQDYGAEVQLCNKCFKEYQKANKLEINADRSHHQFTIAGLEALNEHLEQEETNINMMRSLISDEIETKKSEK